MKLKQGICTAYHVLTNCWMSGKGKQRGLARKGIFLQLLQFLISSTWFCRRAAAEQLMHTSAGSRSAGEQGPLTAITFQRPDPANTARETGIFMQERRLTRARNEAKTQPQSEASHCSHPHPHSFVPPHPISRHGELLQNEMRRTKSVLEGGF